MRNCHRNDFSYNCIFIEKNGLRHFVYLNRELNELHEFLAAPKVRLNGFAV